MESARRYEHRRPGGHAKLIEKQKNSGQSGQSFFEGNVRIPSSGFIYIPKPVQICRLKAIQKRRLEVVSIDTCLTFLLLFLNDNSGGNHHHQTLSIAPDTNILK